MQFIIPPSYHARPLRTYLQQELRLSSRLISALKRDPRGIMLNHTPVTVRQLLSVGDTLQLAIEAATLSSSRAIPPANLSCPPTILYEDRDVTLCAKPAGMPTHPSHGHQTDTLANALAARAPDDVPFIFHPITRLDRNTSGVVLIARHPLSAQRLTDAMIAGDIHKTYLALVQGIPERPRGDIITGIRRRENSIITREATPPDAPNADYAHTRYQVLFPLPFPSPSQTKSTFPRFLSLVCAQPLTGRTHQLRVHFAHLGTPILGDDLYGDGNVALGMKRHALHALALTFPHPATMVPMTLRAPLPADMRAYLPPDFDEFSVLPDDF